METKKEGICIDMLYESGNKHAGIFYEMDLTRGISLTEMKAKFSEIAQAFHILLNKELKDELKEK